MPSRKNHNFIASFIILSLALLVIISAGTASAQETETAVPGATRGVLPSSTPQASDEGVYTGTFLYCEFGDFLHFGMETDTGQQEDFLVWNDFPGIERFTQHAEKYQGKRIKVYWKLEKVSLPEPANMEEEIKSITSVEVEGETVEAVESPQAGSAIGKFLYADWGDFLHIGIEAEDGQKKDFFVVKDFPGIEKFTEHPENYQGKRVKVTWKVEKVFFGEPINAEEDNDNITSIEVLE